MTSVVVGVVGVLLATLFWGCNLSVVKRYDMQDGIVFQFWSAVGVMLVGVCTLFVSANENAVNSTHDFRPVLSWYGIIGGAMWALGNLLTVIIVNRVGLGVGLSIWGGVSLVTSFLFGLLGFMDLKPQVMNLKIAIPGIILAIAALVSFAFVQPTIKSNDATNGNGYVGSAHSFARNTSYQC